MCKLAMFPLDAALESMQTSPSLFMNLESEFLSTGRLDDLAPMHLHGSYGTFSQTLAYTTRILHRSHCTIRLNVYRAG